MRLGKAAIRWFRRRLTDAERHAIDVARYPNAPPHSLCSQTHAEPVLQQAVSRGINETSDGMSEWIEWEDVPTVMEGAEEADTSDSTGQGIERSR